MLIHFYTFQIPESAGTDQYVGTAQGAPERYSKPSVTTRATLADPIVAAPGHCHADLVIVLIIHINFPENYRSRSTSHHPFISERYFRCTSSTAHNDDIASSHPFCELPFTPLQSGHSFLG